MRRIILINLLIICSFANAQEYNKNSIEDNKELIINIISEYGYPYKSGTTFKYIASFEGYYLNLENTRFKNRDILCDFSRSTQFDPVSYRDDDLAYLNIYIYHLANKKKNKWIKDKIVIRIDGHDRAELLQNALKQYRDLVQKEANEN